MEAEIQRMRALATKNGTIKQRTPDALMQISPTHDKLKRIMLMKYEHARKQTKDAEEFHDIPQHRDFIWAKCDLRGLSIHDKGAEYINILTEWRGETMLTKDSRLHVASESISGKEMETFFNTAVIHGHIRASACHRRIVKFVVI
jgi:hypothetical protein